MKFKNFKLSINIAIVCIMLLTSSAAMAGGCGDGVLENETFDGNLLVSLESSCAIISSTIKGNLTIKDTDNVLLLNNKVGGRIRVVRTDGQEGIGVANVIANTVVIGDLIVLEYETTNVVENETLSSDSNFRVNRNTKAFVQKNIAAGNLICRGNTDLSAFLNYADDTLDCD